MLCTQLRTLAAHKFNELGVEDLGVAFVRGAQKLGDGLDLLVVTCAALRTRPPPHPSA